MPRGRGIALRAFAALVTVSLVSLPGCGGGAVDSGGLTAGDRKAAQTAMDALQKSNISAQLVNITDTLQAVPAACRVHLTSKEPRTFKVYVFWIPWLGSEPYTWLDMTLTKDASKESFHL